MQHRIAADDWALDALAEETNQSPGELKALCKLTGIELSCKDGLNVGAMHKLHCLSGDLQCIDDLPAEIEAVRADLAAASAFGDWLKGGTEPPEEEGQEMADSID